MKPNFAVLTLVALVSSVTVMGDGFTPPPVKYDNSATTRPDGSTVNATSETRTAYTVPANAPGQGGNTGQQPNPYVQGGPQQQAIVVPKLPAPGEGIPTELFNAVMSTQYPLSTKQIDTAKKLGDDVGRALAKRPAPHAIAQSSTRMIDFSPNATPEMLRLSSKMPTTVVLTDSTGAPWPIRQVIAGDPQAVYVIDPGRSEPAQGNESAGKTSGPSNMFVLTPRADFIDTAVTVFAEGAPMPVTFMVVSGQKYVDLNVGAVLPLRGPLAKQIEILAGPANTKVADLTAALDGLPLAGAVSLKVFGADAQAWQVGNKVLFRTRADMQSPAVLRVARSPDGMRVYEIPATPVVELRQGGVPQTVKLSGFPPPIYTPANTGAPGVTQSSGLVSDIQISKK
jgi:intracellular multiplication protein IcmK